MDNSITNIFLMNKENCALKLVDEIILRRYMFSSVVVKSVSSCGVYCVPHGTQYTPQLETLLTTTLLNIKRRIFTDYFHKIVTLARFGIGSLVMVQVDRNM